MESENYLTEILFFGGEKEQCLSSAWLLSPCGKRGKMVKLAYKVNKWNYNKIKCENRFNRVINNVSCMYEIWRIKARFSVQWVRRLLFEKQNGPWWNGWRVSPSAGESAKPADFSLKLPSAHGTTGIHGFHTLWHPSEWPWRPPTTTTISTISTTPGGRKSQWHRW